MFELIRTTLLLILGLAAILCIVFPPNYFLWQLKIVVTEFPHLLLLGSLILVAFPGYERHNWLWPQLILALETVVLCLYPILSANSIAEKLPLELKMAFGQSAVSETPFSSFKLVVPAPDSPLPTNRIYYSDQNRALSLDFYSASPAMNAPVIIVIHGGGWNGGDRSQMDHFNRFLAQKGYNVIAMDYSLAPEFQNPQQVVDVGNCLAYLTAHQQEMGLNMSRVVLLGRSAGGQIALQSAYSQGLSNIKGVIAFYTPADMVWGYSLSVDNAVLKSKTLISQYVGGTIEENPEKYQAATAMSYVKPNTPPTLMIHGLKDNMVAYEHNLHLIETLKPAGVPHYLLTLPWATHGADYHLNGPSGQLSSYAILYFLQSVFNPKHPSNHNKS